MHIRIRILTARDNVTRYLFNLGQTWHLLREDGTREDLGAVSHDPVMFQFALEDILAQSADATSLARGLAIARLFCTEAKLNMLHTVDKPHLAAPAPRQPLEPAKPVDLSDLGISLPVAAPALRVV